MRCNWCSRVMGTLKGDSYYKGIKEMCRECNIIAEIYPHLLIPAEERKH